MERVEYPATLQETSLEWTPRRLVVTLAVAILAVELVAMAVIERYASVPWWQLALLDAAALAAIVLPVLHFLVHRPMSATAEGRNRLLGTAVDAAADAVVITDRDGRIVEVNPAFVRLTGYAPEEAVGRTPAMLKSGVHEETFYRDLWDTITAGRVWQGEIVNRRKDGELYVEDQTIAPVRDSSGEISHFIAIKHDVTARRVAEERYRTLFEDSRDAVFVSTLDDRIVDVNRAGVELLGYDSREVLLDRDWSSHWDPEDRAAFGDALERNGYAHNHEVRLTHRGGETRDILASATAIRDAAGDITGYQGILRDVSELREVEERLRQGQKMKAVGRLASGVAHDFNNLLTVINGNAEIARETLEPDHPAAKPLEEIVDTGQIAAALTRRLLSVANGQVVRPETIDLSDTVEACRRLLERTMGEEIAIEFRLTPEPGPIRADPTEVEQILLNLVINARDASPEGGRILVETTVHANHPGRRATDRLSRLRVHDDGEGIPPLLQERIFEPFFTTKEPGHGTGLGLSSVKEIVERRDGRIRVASRPGRGTTFTVDFPRAPDEEGAPRSARPQTTDTTGHESILIVEDDDVVRDLCAAMLRDRGYRVRTAGRVREALALCRRLDEPLDLLLTDIVLPGRRGFDLAEEIAADHPDAAVVYMTGYHVHGSHALPGDLSPDTVILQKPFSREDLLRGVRGALDGRGSHPRPTVS